MQSITFAFKGIEIKGKTLFFDQTQNTMAVLGKWRQYFSSPLNCENSKDLHAFHNTSNQNTGPSDLLFDAHISILEVKKAVDNAKKGKACGIDALPR